MWVGALVFVSLWVGALVSCAVGLGLGFLVSGFVCCGFGLGRREMGLGWFCSGGCLRVAEDVLIDTTNASPNNPNRTHRLTWAAALYDWLRVTEDRVACILTGAGARG